jgi:hypothetical protein
MVLTITDFQLEKIQKENFYKGFLSSDVLLFDVEKNQKLWPQNEEAKSIKVGFEIESAGRESAIRRLARATAFCTTRHLYDCPIAKYKTLDDRSAKLWQQW